MGLSPEVIAECSLFFMGLFLSLHNSSYPGENSLLLKALKSPSCESTIVGITTATMPCCLLDQSPMVFVTETTISSNQRNVNIYMYIYIYIYIYIYTYMYLYIYMYIYIYMDM